MNFKEMEEETTRLKKYCIDTKENREYTLNNLDKMPSTHPLFDKILLEKIQALEETQLLMLKRLEELEK